MARPTPSRPASDPDPEPGGLRAATLAAAARLLATEGPGGLVVRRIASDAGCSTMAVYHYFDGKKGLLDALYVEGFQRLHGAQNIAVTDDPEADVRAMCLAYRTVALAHPEYYQVMFGRPVPDFVPSESSREHARTNYAQFVDAVRRWGARTPLTATTEDAAHVLWAAGHGLVLLELTGNAPEGDAETRYTVAINALLGGLRRPDTPS
ncbi:TetR/AcrR family transcriptional regulator [Pseudonocardia sp. GCM10023141]|uniref:TetR/AcrR family transcriptional regulator n=1 Tax=Pseudonocardia sp. GCM10023141 TaxID=3252653 RepID=UPI003612728D